MKTAITKIYSFEAAHQLVGHAGKCAHLHGHSYKLEVSLSGALIPTGSAEGMVMDFTDLSEVVKKEIIVPWDHTFLNDVVSFRTTVENLAQEIFLRLDTSGLPVVQIRLWETPTGFATVTR